MANRSQKNLPGKRDRNNVITAIPIRRLARNLGLTDAWLGQFLIHLPDGSRLISPRAQWCILMKAIVERFCKRFAPDGVVLLISNGNRTFAYLKAAYLEQLGVKVPAPAKMPDVVVHDVERNWLVLIEAVSAGGPVDGKRRKELKELFAGCKAGLVFVTAFPSREAMRTFLAQISWESEVWVADDPDHLIHFDGERFLGPYPDAIPL